MPNQILILHRDAEAFAESLGRAHPECVFQVAHDEKEALPICADCSAIIAMAHGIPASVVAEMPHLRWIQALTTGIDHLFSLTLPKDIVVTTGRGIHGPQMSELAFLYMLSHFRNLRSLLADQMAAKWQPGPQRLLWGKTVAILGVGAIGEQLALRCKAFGMRVIGISSSRRESPGFDSIVAREEMIAMLPEADILVVLIPYSPETHHIVDARTLAALKPGAFLINIARGGVMDEGALIEALRTGRLAGAGLDVFETEPLPLDSPLWQMENVLITPRIGGYSEVYIQQVMPIVQENVGLYLAGRTNEMRNIADI